MASIHTYTQLNQAVRLYAIDHSVGHGGTNRVDDVQLIQVLINRYKDWREEVFNTGSKSSSSMRVLDRAGQPIDELKVDGHCGALTLAAILSAQRAINAWRGCAIDGRIDASREAGASQYFNGRSFNFAGVRNNVRTHEKIRDTSFNAMYLLANCAGATPDIASAYYTRGHAKVAFDIFSLPEPLKSSLLRASLAAARGVVIAGAVGVFDGFKGRR